MTAPATALRPAVDRRHRSPVAGRARSQWKPADVPPRSPILEYRRPCAPAEVTLPVGTGRHVQSARQVELKARARRRNLVLGAAAIAILVALALPWGGAGGKTLAASGPVLAGATANSSTVYVVQPGDTVWSIAQHLEPGADPRVIVAQLEAEVGSDTLQLGEHIRLP